MLVDQFNQFRPLLFSIAYRMLGVVADVEDVLQECFLRVQSHADETIEKPKQYLTTIVTRLCLNQLSAARSKREQYLGPWLPEPIPTADHPEWVNPLDKALVHDSISIAFLVLLETLQPTERAVFLLHEVFDYKHSEITAILEKSEAACRQILRRAKTQIAERRPRFTTTPAQHSRLLQSFVRVVEQGEIEAFLQMLTEDVTLVPDGGGRAPRRDQHLARTRCGCRLCAGNLQTVAGGRNLSDGMAQRSASNCRHHVRRTALLYALPLW